MKVKMPMSFWQRSAWILVPIIAFGGLYYHKLGLLLLPIMLTLILLGFFRGKYWCGKLCPHGSLFDVILRLFAPPKTSVKLIGSQTLRLGLFVFYMAMFIRRVIKVLPLFGTLSFWDQLGLLLAINYLIPTLVGILLALTVGRRAWCWICPMGTMQQAIHWLGNKTGLNHRTDQRVTPVNLAACRNCGICARVCPMGINLPPQEQLTDPRCIRCGLCIANCPAKVLKFENPRDSADFETKLSA